MQTWVQIFREGYWDLRAGRLIALRVIAARLTQPIVDVRGVRIRVNRSLSYAVIKALLLQYYEGPERKLIEGMLQNDDVVIELGGGLGYISTLCARICDPTRVFVYEANPKMEAVIRDTYRLNGVHPTLHVCMVGPHAGTALLHVSSDFSKSSTIATMPGDAATMVKVVPLIDELERIHPTVLIVDIEGGEYELFREFPQQSCRAIVLELHPRVLGEERAAQVLQWIIATGFRVADSVADRYLFLRTTEPPAAASAC